MMPCVADRATIGIGLATILVVIALAPGGVSWGEPVLLVAAAATLAVTLAPKLPLLQRIPRIGSTKVAMRLTMGEKGEDLSNMPVDARIIVRIGIDNKGTSELERARLNVLIPVPTYIAPCNAEGATVSRGESERLPDTSEQLIPGRNSAAWFERHDLDPGSTILHYAIRFAEPGVYPIRIKLNSKSLYGGKATLDREFRVVS